MKRGRIVSLASAFALLLSSGASNAASWLDGSWEGTIKLGPSIHPFDQRTEQKIRIQIASETVRVFRYDDGKPVELEPGRFHIQQAGGTALIYAQGGGDVYPHKEQAEVLTYAVTLGDRGGLLVEYARVGQATGGEIMAEWTANFGEHGEGQLKAVDNKLGGL